MSSKNNGLSRLSEHLRVAFTFLRSVKFEYFSNSFTIVNSIIGTGIFFLPFVFKRIGLVVTLSYLAWGLVVMSTGAFLGFFAARATIRKHGNNFPTLESYVRKHFGVFAYYFTKINLIFMCFSFIVIYGIFLEELFFSIFGIHKTPLKRNVVIICIFFFETLISFVEKFRDFKLLSYIGIGADFTFILLAFFLYFDKQVQPMGSIRYLPDAFDFKTLVDILRQSGFVFWPFFTIVYFNMQNDTKVKNQNRVGYSLVFSFVIVTIMIFSMGLLGYFSFFEDSRLNLLLSYSQQNVFLSTFLSCLIFLAVLLTFPIFSYLNIIALDDFVLDMANLVLPLFSRGFTCIPAEPPLSQGFIDEVEDITVGCINPKEKGRKTVAAAQKKLKPTVKQRVVRFFRIVIIGSIHNVVCLLFTIFFPDIAKIILISGSIWGTMFGLLIPWGLFYKAIPMNRMQKIVFLVILTICLLNMGIIPGIISIYDLFVDPDGSE